ncbi:MAG: hypothetical protein IPI32_05350 [Austwickia sp.]|jgi:hypothetical protein|nr:hypothetical protein [Austwickia sp.]MBK9100682.1 hypothetical protein [Austwickia sp.]
MPQDTYSTAASTAANPTTPHICCDHATWPTLLPRVPVSGDLDELAERLRSTPGLALATILLQGEVSLWATAIGEPDLASATRELESQLLNRLLIHVELARGALLATLPPALNVPAEPISRRTR